MEIKQLEAYINVYELKSFSKAAKQMHISQPSISAYINALEKSLEAQLIHRKGKEFLPTQTGKLFYEQAKEILSLRDSTLLKMKSIADKKTGNIDILASSVPAQFILPKILANFHKLHPQITFKVNQASSASVIEGLLKHQAEIGFVGSVINNPKCEYENFMTEQLILITPNEARFRHSTNIKNLLQREYFVTRKTGSGTRLEYEEFFKNLGLKPSELKISAHMDDSVSIINAVASGLGLAIVSEIAAQSFLDQKRIIAIEIPKLPKRNFYVVRKKGYPVVPAVDALVDFICKH